MSPPRGFGGVTRPGAVLVLRISHGDASIVTCAVRHGVVASHVCGRTRANCSHNAGAVAQTRTTRDGTHVSRIAPDERVGKRT